jgi:flavin reductase (DIM6/NTAB) family NADH-FMN oxidoreductase RutF
MRRVGFCPVTLITTIGKDDSTNAAPHSRYTIADYSPPQVIISVNTSHDSCRNIIEAKEFVLNIPDSQLLKQIWITQKRFPYGINEIDEAGLTPFPAEKVKSPRIMECNGYIECKVL